MKVGVAATADSLDARVSPQLHRSSCFLVVDSDTYRYEAISSPADEDTDVVRALVDHGAEIIVAGHFGPEDRRALRDANVDFAEVGGRVRDAVSGWYL